MIRAIGAVSLAVVTLAFASCSSSPAPPPPIGVVADSGFRPTPDGLPFANYGEQLADGTTPTNLTVAEMRTMFGDSVCANAGAGGCDLIPEARAWLESTNQLMAGGHCYGFSIAAELLWQDKLDVNNFGVPANAGLDDNNQMLQRTLAYGWAMQLLPAVQSREIDGTPNQILNRLRSVLRPHPSETYTVAIFKPDFTGGHAVTPYAVENKGNGQFNVLIYDNNWPGQTRAIAIDTKADTWTYHAAVNPNEPGSLYTGNADTKTLSLFPTSPGLGAQPCPFCGKEPSTVPAAGAIVSGKTEQITLLGSDVHHANLLITDSTGHRLGYVNGKLVDQIHGARDVPAISGDWTDNIEPNFFVPANGTYTVTVDGTALTGPDTETLRIIGPSYDLSVDNIPVRPGDKDTLVTGTDATKISYTSARRESPTLEFGVSDSRADYAFTITGVSEQPGSTINLGLPPEGGTLTMDNLGSAGTSTVTIKMTRETALGSEAFAHDAIPLIGGDTAQLKFGGWTSVGQGIPLVTTHHGHQSTETLANQPSG